VAGALLIGVAFGVPAPRRPEPQGLRAAWPALRDHQVSAGLWLTMGPGLGFGVIDVLAPLRLSHLGASATVIGLAFLLAAAIESGLAPLAGRVADRRGALIPICLALIVAVVTSLLIPLVPSAFALVLVLVLGMPGFGALFAPASAMLSAGADRLALNQGIAFGMANLAWAGGQALSAAAGGALAQVTSDFVPYAVLGSACLITLATLQRRARQAWRATSRHRHPGSTPTSAPDTSATTSTRDTSAAIGTSAIAGTTGTSGTTLASGTTGATRAPGTTSAADTPATEPPRPLDVR
jgi:MFS family permease